MLIIIEGLVMCFWLLIVCVVGIANAPVGLVVFYEQDVQDRVVELGLTTKEKIKKSSVLSGIALFLPIFTVVPAMVCFLNGAKGFLDVFFQTSFQFLLLFYMLHILTDHQPIAECHPQGFAPKEKGLHSGQVCVLLAVALL